MELSKRADIEAPIDYVFDQVTDFPTFERGVMRRGGDIERLEDGAKDGLGAKWRVKFLMRGVERKITAEVTQVEKPNQLLLKLTSKNVNGTVQIDLVALSPARTRMNVRFEAQAKTIPAKLLFQSLRFARQRTQGRFDGAVDRFAKDLEDRYRA